MAKKYIDAEKLKAHIEAKMEILWDKLPDADKEHPTDIELRDLGMYMALEGLIDDLDSLQQERPDCHTVEDWMQHIKNADQLTKDIFSNGPYDVLYDALNHPYQHCYDAIKEFGELCFQTGVNSVKQERQEVDLEKIIEQTYHDGSVADTDDIDHVTYESIARYFYELGKNSK